MVGIRGYDDNDDDDEMLKKINETIERLNGNHHTRSYVASCGCTFQHVAQLDEWVLLEIGNITCYHASNVWQWPTDDVTEIPIIGGGNSSGHSQAMIRLKPLISSGSTFRWVPKDHPYAQHQLTRALMSMNNRYTYSSTTMTMGLNELTDEYPF